MGEHLALPHAVGGRLVDEVQLRVCPTVIGAGKPVFPSGQFSMELIEARPLATNGALLRYRSS